MAALTTDDQGATLIREPMALSTKLYREEIARRQEAAMLDEARADAS